MNYVLLFGMPGGGELFLIVLVIIMLFGSKKIPELARGLGKGMREIKNATGEIQREIRDGVRDINVAKGEVDIEEQVKNIITEDRKEKKEEREKSKEDEHPIDSHKTEFQTIQRKSPQTSSENQPQTDNS